MTRLGGQEEARQLLTCTLHWRSGLLSAEQLGCALPAAAAVGEGTAPRVGGVGGGDVLVLVQSYPHVRRLCNDRFDGGVFVGGQQEIV